MFGSHDNDIAHTLSSIKSAIKKEHSFKHYADKHIAKFVMEEAKRAAHFISQYTIEDSMHIHHSKKELLSAIIKKLNHLFSSARYYYHRSEFDRGELLKITEKIESLFKEYSKSGSVYIFRHCQKIKRTDKRGEVYDGIPTEAIKKEAMERSKEIIKEILISPKKVKVVLFHSEMKRTRIFKDIIIREIKHHLHHCKDKVEIEDKGFDSRIRFDYFTKEALGEVKPLYKEKGPFYCFTKWYYNKDEFKNFKLQPKPEEVIKGVNDFVMNAVDASKKTDAYTIVIGISHGWIIDAFLLYKIPGLNNQIKHLIETAAFFKAECDEMNYLGKWVKL